MSIAFKLNQSDVDEHALHVLIHIGALRQCIARCSERSLKHEDVFCYAPTRDWECKPKPGGSRGWCGAREAATHPIASFF